MGGGVRVPIVGGRCRWGCKGTHCGGEGVRVYTVVHDWVF